MRVLVLVLVLALAPGAAASAGVEAPAYVAESLLGAKWEVRALDAAVLLRPAWESRLTGAGVRVGVVDTGVDGSHPDLAGAVASWRDFAGDADGRLRDEPYDDNGHGTHVAAVLAGRGHLDWNPLHAYWLTGARGFAPGADLLVAKAMRADGRGDDATVARAIDWCVDPNGDGDRSDGADVLSLSVGIDVPGRVAAAAGVGEGTRRAVADALAAGVVVVVSSGNEGEHEVATPGDVPGVIAVGALDRDGRLAAFTNTGPGLDLLAPGVLVSAYPVALDTMDFAEDGYTGLAGTSMAAPVVAALAALVLEAEPALRGDVGGVERLLLAHAAPLDPPDARAGDALVLDAFATLAAVDEPTGTIDPPALAASAAGVLALAALVALLARRLARRSQASHGLHR